MIMMMMQKYLLFSGLYPLIGWKIGDREITYLAEGLASDIGRILTWAQSLGTFKHVNKI